MVFSSADRIFVTNLESLAAPHELFSKLSDRWGGGGGGIGGTAWVKQITGKARHMRFEYVHCKKG